MPSDMSQYVFCILILILGAFMEAYIIGGITAEISKAGESEMKNNKLYEYVKFIIETHNFP